MSGTPASPAAAFAAAGLLAVVIGGCASPPPSATATVSRPAAGPTSPAAGASPTTSASHDFSSLVDLGRELEIGVVPAAHTEQLAEFGSDGSAVVYSSGIEGDGPGAPDLWRLEPFGEPELIWRNPNRDHSIVHLGGDLDTYAFVDIPLTGERAWTLYLVPRPGEEAIVLDEHPGDEDVPSLVPSFTILERRIVWTAFDRGLEGPVSQLLTAREPTWEPELLFEYPASEIEIWFPSLYGSQVVYSEVRYLDDGASDERSVWELQLGDTAGRRRLDTTGRATMPVKVPGAILWKQADPGYNMFNWGRMYRYDLETEEVSPIDLSPQTYVNYPSAGGRFAAWRGADSFSFGVYDHILDEPRLIEQNPPGSDTGVLRPHLREGLLVWMRVVGTDADATTEVRYAFLPDAAELR